MAVVALDSLGTLFDLGELEGRMPLVLHHALSLTVAGGWLPLDEVAAALDPDLARQLSELDPYDDALTAIERVRTSGAEAWVLTNGGRDATTKLLERGGLAGFVAEIRSAEQVERYKPHPAVYELLPADAVLVAAHAWDVVGAHATGRRAVWVDRLEQSWPYPGTAEPARAPTLVEAALLASSP